MKRPRAKTRLCKLDPAGIPLNKISFEELQRIFCVAGLTSGRACKKNSAPPPPPVIECKLPTAVPLRKRDERETVKAKSPANAPASKPWRFMPFISGGRVRFARRLRTKPARTPTYSNESDE